MSSTGISLREFARRSGCDLKQVRRAVKSGKLKLNLDKSIDPAQLEITWRRQTRASRKSEGIPKVSSPARVDIKNVSTTMPTPLSAVEGEDSPLAIAEKLIANASELLSYNDALTLKENYNARLKRLEFDIKSGLVVMAEDVVREVGEEYAKVRTRLLAIPSEQAPRVHRLRTVAEVQSVLQDVISEALEELTKDEI